MKLSVFVATAILLFEGYALAKIKGVSPSLCCLEDKLLISAIFDYRTVSRLQINVPFRAGLTRRELIDISLVHLEPL